VKDLSWFRPDGKEMSDDDWNVFTRCLGLRLAGDAIADVDTSGRPVLDDTLLLLINAHWEPIPFVLPAHQRSVRWEPVLDTREPDGQPRSRSFRGGQTYPLEARSMVLLRLPHHETGDSKEQETHSV
jgi:glycogen operon protein